MRGSSRKRILWRTGLVKYFRRSPLPRVDHPLHPGRGLRRSPALASEYPTGIRSICGRCLGESVATFWQSGPELAQFRAHISLPETPYPILKRLGDPDFMPEARRWLAKANDAVAVTAMFVAVIAMFVAVTAMSVAFDQERDEENVSEAA